jgi:hypothetical protein
MPDRLDCPERKNSNYAEVYLPRIVLIRSTTSVCASRASIIVVWASSPVAGVRRDSSRGIESRFKHPVYVFGNTQIRLFSSRKTKSSDRR